MCKVNNQWCVEIVKWYTPKRQYRLYCKAHGFTAQPYLTKEEVEYFKTHHSDLISNNDGTVNSYAPEQHAAKIKLDNFWKGRSNK